MKSTGIFRRVDVLGRVVLPMEIRNNLDLKPCELMEIYLDSDKIILSKFSNLSRGMVRKIDKLGRIVIPSEIRDNLGINTKDSMEILIDGESIILKKYSPRCIFCDSYEDGFIKYKEKNICKNCAKSISKL